MFNHISLLIFFSALEKIAEEFAGKDVLQPVLDQFNSKYADFILQIRERKPWFIKLID